MNEWKLNLNKNNAENYSVGREKQLQTMKATI